MNELLSVAEVRSRILSHFAPLPTLQQPLARACGHVLAEAITAPMDLPPFTNSSVDGFAVRATDIQAAGPESPVILKVIGDVPAGTLPTFVISPGTTARIMTGAPLPDGSDAVVPVEDTNFPYRDPHAPLPAEVRIFRSLRPGTNVRHQGQDVRRGQVVLSPGHRLRPQDLGFLAALGVQKVLVHRRPRVALFSSGDELISPGEPLTPGKIYDANRLMLATLVEHYGGETIDLGIAHDDPAEVRRLFEHAHAQQCDLILSTAGVSVGTYDYVRQILEQNGTIHLWRVNVRPGKPLVFGSYRETPVIALPGNPVSAYVGFHLFVVPALRRLLGMKDAMVPRIRATLDEPLESDGRESYLRAIVHYENGQPHARLSGHQSSADLAGLAQANALIIIPAGVKSLPAGSQVEVWPLNSEE